MLEHKDLAIENLPQHCRSTLVPTPFSTVLSLFIFGFSSSNKTYFNSFSCIKDTNWSTKWPSKPMYDLYVFILIDVSLTSLWAFLVSLHCLPLEGVFIRDLSQKSRQIQRMNCICSCTVKMFYNIKDPFAEVKF